MNHSIRKADRITLGEGTPKICVPLTARNFAGMDRQLRQICAAPCDMVELRADYFDGDPIEELAVLCARMPDMPVLFTFRTKEEGGERAISPEEYASLNLRAAGISPDEKLTSKGISADFIDLEVNRGEEFLRSLCCQLHKGGAKVIASFHDFGGTPDEDTLIRLLCRMQELGADVTKAALMPHTERDVLTLLSVGVAMKEHYADRPYILMSMGRLGAVSRLACHLTGSAVTFASAGAASAPGQMDAGLVARALDML